MKKITQKSPTNKIPKDKFDAVVLAVAHKEFNTLELEQTCKDNHVIYDVKGILDKKMIDERL